MSEVKTVFEELDEKDKERLKELIPPNDKEFYEWIKRYRNISDVLEISKEAYKYITCDVYIKLQKVLLGDSRLEGGYWLLKDALGLKNEEITREILLRATIISDILLMLFDHVVGKAIPSKLPMPVVPVIQQLMKEQNDDYIY